jgi:geranylgeranyl diphosphate synthase, type II
VIEAVDDRAPEATASPSPSVVRQHGLSAAELETYLADCRALTLRHLEEIIPRRGRYREVLYDLMLEYPLRVSKGLRPALCIAACRALGGAQEFVLRSAAVLELYHNAFLIHDDVEDGSETRRDQPTLHGTHGVPIAVNVGDGMLALALQPLLDNTRVLGLGKALRILQVIARMARETAEGQAVELHWIRSAQWQLADADYIRMVYKKTSWYTFITPVLLGGLSAGAPREQMATLRKFAALLGIAFQIQDDVLNLVGEAESYGKEIAGDLWEGKHTLILMHALRCAAPEERARAERILLRPRPASSAAPNRVEGLLAELEREGEVSAAARSSITAALARAAEGASVAKSEADVRYLLRLIEGHGSVPYARDVAQRYARKAQRLLDAAVWLRPSVHRDFLRGLVSFVVDRER